MMKGFIHSFRDTTGRIGGEDQGVHASTLLSDGVRFCVQFWLSFKKHSYVLGGDRTRDH